MPQSVRKRLLRSARSIQRIAQRNSAGAGAGSSVALGRGASDLRICTCAFSLAFRSSFGVFDHPSISCQLALLFYESWCEQWLQHVTMIL